jgi:hypothetical protein
MSACTHDLAERETACADGMCPMCIADKIERLERDYEELGASVMNLSHPNCQLLLNDKRKAERERDEALALLREAREDVACCDTFIGSRQDRLARIDALVEGKSDAKSV